MSILGFPGDHDTYGLAVFVGNDDGAFKAVRHTWAWDPLMAAFPRVAPWADPANGVPLTDVQFMGGHQNVRRHFVVDGRPLVHNLLPIGDALCTTNPIYGWGASMALTYAFAAVESAEAHAGDPGAMALAFDEAVRDEADGVDRESAAMDRAGATSGAARRSRRGIGRRWSARSSSPASSPARHATRCWVAPRCGA